MVFKLRAKLKLVEELISSLQTPQPGSRKNSLSFTRIKNITMYMLRTVDLLEELMARHLVLTDYILRMKIIIIRPTHKLIRKIAHVNTLQTDPTADLARTKFLREAESAYDAARSQPLLVAVSFTLSSIT